MNLIQYLKQLWRQRRLTAAAAALALAIALLAVYRVGLLPPSLSQRGEAEGRGSVQLLVDSASSPIADARRDVSGLIVRAGVFAQLMSGGRVVGQIAREAGVPAGRIDVAGPQPQPGEAPGAEASAARFNPYGIEIDQQPELPIVSVVTRAPSVEQARALAAAAPVAIADVVESIQARQQTPPAKRVEFRPLGPAAAAPVDEAPGKKLALALFLVLLLAFCALILLVPRLRAAWREDDEDDGDDPAGPRRSPPLLLYTDAGDPEAGVSSSVRRVGPRRER